MASIVTTYAQRYFAHLTTEDLLSDAILIQHIEDMSNRGCPLKLVIVVREDLVDLALLAVAVFQKQNSLLLAYSHIRNTA